MVQLKLGHLGSAVSVKGEEAGSWLGIVWYSSAPWKTAAIFRSWKELSRFTQEMTLEAGNSAFPSPQFTRKFCTFRSIVQNVSDAVSVIS